MQPASLDLRLGERALRITVQLPPRRRLGRAQAQGLRPRRDRPEGRRRDARGPLPVPGGAEGAPGPARRAAWQGQSQELDGPDRHLHRVVADRSDRFDEVAPGYSGPLYLEVVPLSFAVRVKEDLTLNQLRLSVGRPWLSDDEVRRRTPPPRSSSAGENGFPTRSWCFWTGCSSAATCAGTRGARSATAHRDTRAAARSDLGRRRRPGTLLGSGLPRRGGPAGALPRRFYLLMSDESVCIPPTLAAEMTAYDPTSGELRTHYAGFFDPGFGFDPKGMFRGSRPRSRSGPMTSRSWWRTASPCAS